MPLRQAFCKHFCAEQASHAPSGRGGLGDFVNAIIFRFAMTLMVVGCFFHALVFLFAEFPLTVAKMLFFRNRLLSFF